MILYIHKKRGRVKRLVYLNLSEIQDELEQANIYLGDKVQLGDKVHIGIESQIFRNVVLQDTASIGRRVVLHAGVRVGSGAYIKDESVIREGSTIKQGATVFDNCVLGKGVTIGKDVRIPKFSVISDYVDLSTSFFRQGSRDLVVYLGAEQLIIGCIQQSVSWWLSNYNTVGMSNGYTEEQIAEYYGYMVEANNF